MNRITWTVFGLVAGFVVWGIPHYAEAANGCGVTAHRLGPTNTIDDNTLEGLARSTRLGARGEADLLPLTDGYVLFHQKRWEQGTTGQGVPWQTSSGYADNLVTETNRQQVPLYGQALAQARQDDSKMLFEAHYWTDAWSKAKLETAVNRADGVNDWWTGTNGMMMALADIAPSVTTVWRVDPDETPTRSYIESRSIEVLHVVPQTSAADIDRWRSWGLKVQGRNTTTAEFDMAFNRGLRTVQVLTGGGIGPWLNYCEGRA